MASKGFSFPLTTLAGTSFGNFLALCKGHRIETWYLGKYVLSMLVALIFEIFNAIERLFWKRKIDKFKLAEPPVFIIGPWRSGTTLLHNLLCQDPKAAYTTTFHAVFPNVLLTQSSWVKPIIRYLGPSRRPVDNIKMDMDFPQEEEFGLMNLQPSSIYKFFIFPKDFNRIVEAEFMTGHLPEKSVRLWKRKYREMVAQAVFNTGGSRYFSKNPCHIGRLDLLLEMYPNAKFIFIYRNPYSSVESLYRFILEINHGVQLQATPESFTRENVVMLYEKAVRTYLANKSLINPENLVELKMEDFKKDPSANIREAYNKFHLDNFHELEPRLDQYLTNDEHSGSGAYNMDTQTIRLVNQNMEDILKLWNYERIEAG